MENNLNGNIGVIPPSKEKKLDKTHLIDAFNFIITLIVSVFLYKFGFSLVFFLVPLMVFSIGKKKWQIGLSFFLTFLIIAVLEAWPILLSMNFKDINATLLLSFRVLIPALLLVSGITWISTKGRNVYFRVALLYVPLLLFISLASLWIVGDRALFSEIYIQIKNAFVQVLEPIKETINLNLNEESFLILMLSTLASLVLPLYTLAVCVPAFWYESAVHSKESDWEDKVANFEFNPDLIWAFLVSWAFVLLCHLVSLPLSFIIIAFNFAFTFSLIYIAQGFTVVFCWLKGRIQKLRSLTIFALEAIILFCVPLLNFILLIIMLVAGLLETFFDLKKIGGKNENYS